MNPIDIDSVSRILTVLISFAVVSAPILYPKYSYFTHQAEQGLVTLKQIRQVDGDIRLAYLEAGEKGFKQVSEVAEYVFGFDGDANRFCMAVGQPRALGEYTSLGMKYGIGDNGALYAETDQGPELLRWEPWSPTSALELEKLERGIKLRARERSHLVTVGLAVLWTTLSIVTVL